MIIYSLCGALLERRGVALTDTASRRSASMRSTNLVWKRVILQELHKTD